MRETNLDLFDPRTVRGSDYSPDARRDDDFAFAFNDSNFSDGVLRIEIMADSPEARSDGDTCHGEDLKKDNAVDTSGCPEEQISNCTRADHDDGVGHENQDEEAVAMIEESASGDEAANSNDSNWSMDCSTVLSVKTLHISSPILVAKSPFFDKLFSNGMRESEQRHVTLRINASEEAALMKLLKFMYGDTLLETTAPDLLDVLMAADKFDVTSCMWHCSRLLRNLPMTRESALLYLELPSSVLMADAVQPLTDAAKQFLAALYRDITKFEDEVMKLPLAGIEAILSSDDLWVPSEDTIYDFVLGWARAHYPNVEERREILVSCLARYIRVPYMTYLKLEEVLGCSDLDHEFASKILSEAPYVKAGAPPPQQTLAAEESATTKPRAYWFRPIKVLVCKHPRQRCVVYLDLKREECAKLFPSGQVRSRAFRFGGQLFRLLARCNMDEQGLFYCLGLLLLMRAGGSVTFALDYEFAARSKPTEDFFSKYKGNYTVKGGTAVGCRSLFPIPWVLFLAEHSPYFINGILHLRVELTIRH